MFLRMLFRSLTFNRGGKVLIALTTALGSCVATSMLAVMFDIGDKVSRELSTYGANIVVRPRGAAVLDQFYDLDGIEAGEPLREDQVANIKTIFWAFNVLQFSPFLSVKGEANGEPVTLVGTWFAKELSLPTGEMAVAGLIGLRSWWSIDGGWIADAEEDMVLIGVTAAARLGLALGDYVDVGVGSGAGVGTGVGDGGGGGAGDGGGGGADGGSGGDAVDGQSVRLRIAGIINSGGDEDDQIIAPMAVIQRLSDREGEVDWIEVSALTTPDNDLSRRAARSPQSLSVSDWETWYCTAYASAIAYQIEEVIDGAVAKPVRLVTETQGVILTKTQLLMVLVTVLALLSAALCIANLVTASVLERSAEIGLLKAIGATNGAVVRLILSEMSVVGALGGLLGYGLGVAASQVIGQVVFGSWISIRAAVAGLTAVLVVLVVLAGSLPAVSQLLRLRPADVLHGR
ncbi:MAG: FtsX-like permease family protein [Propionibacteriaceae bacterium]|jgi:putative ABC transport system permease protein|nr:FtsX-like permease family protein [Propionibacteriaceae bacterium]